MTDFWLHSPHDLTEPVEMDSTAKEQWSATGINCTVDLRCPWAERHKQLINILENANPWPYPFDDDFGEITSYALSASVQNLKAAGATEGQGNSYEHAILTVNYGSLQSGGNGPSQLFTESLEPSGELLTLPAEFFSWTSDDTDGTDVLKEDEAPSKPVLACDYCVTYFRVAEIPISILTLVDHVNEANVFSASLGLTFPAETLLFQPPKVSRTVAAGSANLWTLDCRFSFRQNGWNKFWRAKELEWGQVYIKGTTTVYKSFPTGNFVGLVP